MTVGGAVRVPGDKSITHRLLMLAGLARGSSRIRGVLTSLDARSTARCIRALAATISPLRPGAVVTVVGRGTFRAPGASLNCGNAGTTARLLLGLLAAHPFRVTLTGDRSLRRRPMWRVTEPLERMGAGFMPEAAATLPLTIRGGPLRSLRWDLPVSSAQLKGALLFAAAAGGVEVSIREPGGLSRDHTERLLRAFGYDVRDRDGRIEFRPTGTLTPIDVTVPGDASSAAFLAGAALIAERGSIRIEGVGLNPTRTGFAAVLQRMGGKVVEEQQPEQCGEPFGALEVEASELRATEITTLEVPSLIDEIPLLAVVAARARGTTVFREVGELRVKESDRLALIAENLRAVGAVAEARGHDLFVEGSDTPPRGRVRTDGDHRLAMAFAVLGTVTGARVMIDDPACADVSFPGFRGALRSIQRRS